MSKSDVERVLKQLKAQPARPQLVNTLVEVRKRIINTKSGLEEFVRQGGLTPLTELLKQPQPAEVFNVTLSVLGNCTARPSGRQHFTQHGGIHAVLNVLQLVADPEVANRACRTLANLAQEPALCRTLLQEDTLELVQALMVPPDQTTPQPVPDELKTTVFRLWRLLADRDSHRRRLLRSECLVTVAGALGSQNKQLVREALRGLAHFAASAARETGAQMQQSANAMQTLLRLCGADAVIDTDTAAEQSAGITSNDGCSSDTAGIAPPPPPPPPLQDPELATAAFRLALTLAQESSLRPTLGQFGFLQLLWRGIHGPGAGETAGASTGETSRETSSAEESTASLPEAGGRPSTAEQAGKKRGSPHDSAGSNSTSGGSASGQKKSGGTARPRKETPGRSLEDSVEADFSDTISVTSVTSAVDRGSLVSALCLFCWESVNRARLRSLGYLPWLVRVLGSSSEPESLRRRVLHSLFQFVYDDAGFAQMKRAGLIAVLVGRLEGLVAGWEREAERDGQRRGAIGGRRSDSPASSDCSDGEDSDEGGEDGSSVGYRADSPTYRQVEREIESYLREVRRSEPPADRLFKSFSPTDSLASSPLRSPDVSPPSWRLAVPSPGSSSPAGSWGDSQFSPPVSPGGWQFSPPVSPGSRTSLSPSPLPPTSMGGGGGGRFSPPVSPSAAAAGAGTDVSPLERLMDQWSPRVSPRAADPLSPAARRDGGRGSSAEGEFSPRVGASGSESRSPSLSSPGGSSRPSKRRRLYSAEVSADSTARRGGGEEHGWLLLLLSRESQAERPDRQLASAACCRALIDTLRLAPQPQPRAGRILARLGRNPYCFRPLVLQKLAWLCVSSLRPRQAEPALSALQSVAHSGYGQGVLESLMELGGDEATAAVITACVVVSLQTSLRRLLQRRSGLDLLLDQLVSAEDDTAGPAAGALAALCQHLSPSDRPPPLPSGSEATETSAEHTATAAAVAASGCRYTAEPRPPDLTLVLSDGEVAARRDRLASGSPVLAALLTGGFRESTTTRVPLGEMERAVAAPLVHLAYGCGEGCRLLSRLPARLWLPLLAAADRFLLTDAAEVLSTRVLAARRPARLAALYRASRSQHLALDGAAGWPLRLLLLRRLLATGARRAADPLRLLLRDGPQELVEDVRDVVSRLLEPTVA